MELLSSVILLLILVSPAWCEDKLTYTVLEEKPPAAISNIAQDAGLDKKYSVDVFTQLRYSLGGVPVKHQGLLTIDETTGVLSTAQRIDRDLICPNEDQCVIALQVQVKSPHFQIILVDVTIEDFNDNAPWFPTAVVQRTLTEASLLGASLTLPTADDLDSPVFGVRWYNLTGSTDIFELKISTLTDGTVIIKLVLKERLDREKKDSYTLQLIAYDGGSPSKSGSITINVLVLDVNDNNPQFDNQTYRVSVKENMKPHSRVIQVRAQDADIGANGALTYRFAAKTQKMLGNLFSINDTNGDILVTGKLDYEESSTYTMIVLAQDKNPDSLAQATVIVSVQDLNDNAPKIKLNDAEVDGSVHISELTKKGSFVAHITVRDPDGGVNGMFSCSLQHDHFTIVQLLETEFKIVTSTVFNREAMASYDVEVVCMDKGVPPLSSSEHIIVNIMDENDHNPRFRQPTYRATIRENDADKPFLIMVEAFDEDVGENANITYRLEDEVSGIFNVDGISGNLTLSVPLDYEQVHRIQISVLAVDHGTPALTGTAAVIIDILDVDDENPKFSQKHYMFEVAENEPIDTSINQVFASDADSTQFNKFILSIDPDSEAYDTFALDSNSGVIYTRKVLDREVQDIHELKVLAVSVGLRAVTSTTVVSITVIDKNDNSPQIEFPNPQNNTVYISNQTPVGIMVVKVLSHDLDIGANGMLNYTILSGNTDGRFSIDSQTGLIRVAKELTAIENRAFGLVLLVTDGGDEPRSAESLISLVVNKSIIYPVELSSKELTNQNLTIVICIAVLSGILTVVLLVAIMVLLRQRRSVKNCKYNYAARVMDQRAAICSGQPTNSEESGSNSSHQDLFLTQYDSQVITQNRHNESFASEAPSVATNASSLQLTGANIQVGTPCFYSIHILLQHNLNCSQILYLML